MCWDSLGSKNTLIRYENTASGKKLTIFCSTSEIELVFFFFVPCMHKDMHMHNFHKSG